MTESSDPYLIPGTEVLRNTLGAHTSEELAAAENDLVNARFIKLNEMPLKAEGTLAQLQWIHHYLFQDVYGWAGQIRTIDMSKGGGSVFLPLRFFATGVTYAEHTLRDDRLLTGMDRERFIQLLSVNYDNFNTLHPFREGNGRAQRVFWTLIARDAGWGLNWSRVSKDENDHASFIAHENVDYAPLESMFANIVQPLNIHNDRHTLPTIGLDSPQGTDRPNVYQVLSDQDYAYHRHRLDHQRNTQETQQE